MVGRLVEDINQIEAREKIYIYSRDIILYYVRRMENRDTGTVRQAKRVQSSIRY